MKKPKEKKKPGKVCYLKLFPTEEQKELIDITFYGYNFIYNRALEMIVNARETRILGRIIEKEFRENPEKIANSSSYIPYEIKTFKGYRYGIKHINCLLTQLKKTKKYSWLNRLDSQALKCSLIELDKEINQFLSSPLRYDFPMSRFPNDHRYKTYAGFNKVRIDFENRKIKLPKLGLVSYSGNDEGLKEQVRLFSATVYKNRSNEYIVTIQYDTVENYEKRMECWQKPKTVLAN